MDETTPLLREQNDNDHNEENSTAAPPTSSSRILTILVWSSIIIAALTFLYSLTVYLVVKTSPYYDFIHWGMRESIEVLLPLAFLCVIVSLFGIFKLTVPNGGAWLFVNLIFDPLIVFLLQLLLTLPLRGWELSDWGYCGERSPRRGFPDPGFEARCDRFASAINAAILVGVVFQMMILSLHLVFFICDVVLGIKRLREHGVGWRLPTGQFTVEFTVKVLRQRDDSVTAEL